MNKNPYLSVILIFATILFTSCSSQYVIYSVSNITLPPETAKTIPINVNVKIFSDNRANILDNKVLFSNSSRETRMDGKAFCINAEKYYKKETVVTQITRLLVRHFNQAKLFSFDKEYLGNFPADADCKCIYENVNAKLKEFNTELIEKIRTELVGVKF